MDKVGFSDFLLCWRPVSKSEAGRARVSLRVPFARSSELEAALSCAHEMLEQSPGAFEALALLDLLTPPSRRRTLRERYEAFLLAAPFHPEAKRVREDLIDLLLDQRLYGAAAPHIAALTLRRVRPTRVEEQKGTRSAEHARSDPGDHYEELDELDLEPCEDWELRAFPRFKVGD